VLEQDIALTNIALDLLGQARYLYQYLSTLEEGEVTEDALAYLRDERQFKNLLMVELSNGDWGFTVLRQFLFSIFQQGLYRSWSEGNHPSLSDIARKAIKEVDYHVRWSSEWVIRLGDGTEESRKRMQDALDTVWPYTGEMFVDEPADFFMESSGFVARPSSLQQAWRNQVREVLMEATLDEPVDGWSHGGGREGFHSEHLGYLLAEMQYVQRSYPHCTW
jgi:ring-1,2-phenylacetyl-CoA epoxidase subunit PaaC